MSRSIANLQELGLVQVTDYEDDHRVTLIRLTEAGRAHMQAYLSAITKGLDVADRVN